jgi:hypothetical protein
MSETTIIKLAEPLPCCALIAIHRRCNEPASVAQATLLADGSYHLQPFCKDCALAMAKNYGVDVKASEE